MVVNIIITTFKLLKALKTHVLRQTYTPQDILEGRYIYSKRGKLAPAHKMDTAPICRHWRTELWIQVVHKRKDWRLFFQATKLKDRERTYLQGKVLNNDMLFS